jgi:hypothetical protein
MDALAVALEADYISHDRHFAQTGEAVRHRFFSLWILQFHL